MLISPNLHIDEEWKGFQVTEREKFTILHCTFFAASPVKLRVWKKRANLFDQDGIKYRVCEVYNIMFFPFWTYYYPENGYCCFTLAFEGLRKECTQFKFIEDLKDVDKLYKLSERGGFYSEMITRNKTDVYHITVKFA